MNIPMFILSVALMLLGAVIWRFRLIHLLSNVDMKEVDDTRKLGLARYAGCFVILVGGIFAVLAYLIGNVTTEREMLILLACMIPIIMIATVFYLAGLKKFMKK